MRQESSGNHSKGTLATGQGYFETLHKKVSCGTWSKCFKDSDKQTGRRN